MEEDSLIRVNNNQGGVDDVNADVTIDKALSDTMFNEVHDGMDDVLEGFKNQKERPRFMVQESILGSKVLTETYSNFDSGNGSGVGINKPTYISDKMTLKLFYEPGCPHSEEFMSIWTQIKEVLPSNVEAEEINCKRKDVLGFSLCHTYKVSQIPTVILIRPDVLKPDEEIHVTYRGKKDFLSIKQWLYTQKIDVGYNPEVEHFDRTGGYVSVSEEFNGLTTGIAGGDFGGAVLSADGNSNLRAPYDKMYRDASKMNEHGEFHDMDENGCPIANFSRCNENSPQPGYQIFTHRGQWGCVYPDKNTSLNTGFDAAFATVDHYLNSLPPRMEQRTDADGKVSLVEVPYDADEKLAKMKKCANVYKREIREFGLCNNDKLNAKYNIKDMIAGGQAKLPFDGMSMDDYKDAANTAEAIYGACSL
jgi:thiol-disulfide isomerase/thioredoxin